MAMTALAPQRIAKLVVIDIAPVNYPTRRHDEMFAAIEDVNKAQITERRAAASLMHNTIDDSSIIQFLLKSFHHGEWRFNVPVLWQNYATISGWQPIASWHHPVLFIRGKNSAYLDDSYRSTLLSQFPLAKAHVIAGAGHWVHAEKPDAVARAVHRFLDIQG